jgi:glucose/arabinose dehydrogenase
MKKLILMVGILILTVAGFFILPKFYSGNEQGFCTLEAKLCPDGSYVGRVPPSCEFAQCPAAPNGSASFKNIENLNIPWEVVFLPGTNETLITERAGNIVKISADGSRKSIPIPDVNHSGEGGLLGLALHPQFTSNRQLYVYLTTRTAQGTTNRVERYDFKNDALENQKLIIENIPGAVYHDGGRIAFGPDGMLYITTGDAGRENLAQDKNSLAGKILRVKDDGSIPGDNPFGTAVYSYGHRNPQGLAWDNQGRLWATEHGRSGVLSGYDELNLIKKGANYGWPKIQGDQTRTGMERPVIQSGATSTWAPSGMVYKGGKIYFVGLRGEALYKTEITSDGSAAALKVYFKGVYGRLRTVVLGPAGELYVLTSNTDGRGREKPGDDKLIKINL